MSRKAPLRIAVFGAARTGRSRLSAELAAASPDLQVNEGVLSLGDSPCLAGSPSALTAATAPDLVLLTGLDLALPGATPATQVAEDTRLRLALQAAGLGWRVVYGQGADRTQHALQAVAEVAPWAWTIPVNEAEAGRWQRLQASCEKCGDSGCEHRLFTRLANE